MNCVVGSRGRIENRNGKKKKQKHLSFLCDVCMCELKRHAEYS